MTALLFTKPKKAIGIDIGTHSVKAIQMSRIKGRLHVDEVGYALVDRTQVAMDPVIAHADALREAVRTMQVSQSLLVGALPGQTAVIRYPRLPDMPFGEIGDAIEAETGQNIPYDLAEVYLDWSLLDTVTEGDEKMLRILLVAAKEAVVTSRIQIVEAAEMQCGILSVDSLALADAAESCDFLRVGESVALINIGLTSASIHFTKDGVSNFIRDVNWGAREFIQAIAKNKRCEYADAEQALYDYGAGQGDEEPEALPAQEDESATVDKDVEIVGSPLDPLDEELAEMDAAPARPSRGGAGPGSQEKSMREVLNVTLGRLVAEIRRSFDYYEHQLYERPVDRLILSGGIAHLDLLRQNLTDELGIGRVEIANPTDSALLLDSGASFDLIEQHPAQYMVAVGLAARGMAEI